MVTAHPLLLTMLSSFSSMLLLRIETMLHILAFVFAVMRAERRIPFSGIGVKERGAP